MATSERTAHPVRMAAPFGIGDPLDFIHADHERQRQICIQMREIGNAGQITAEQAAYLVDYLTEHLVQHHADEEDALFPILRRRVVPEDELDDVLLRLQSDHSKSNELLRDIVPFLQSAAGGECSPVPSQLAAKFLRYAANEHRHLAIENAVVMTIARVRLTRADLGAIRDLMRIRREQTG